MSDLATKSCSSSTSTAFTWTRLQVAARRKPGCAAPSPCGVGRAGVEPERAPSPIRRKEPRRPAHTLFAPIHPHPIGAMPPSGVGDRFLGHVVLHAWDRETRQAVEDALRVQTLHDPLTGLPNRGLGGSRVWSAWTRPAPPRSPNNPREEETASSPAPSTQSHERRRRPTSLDQLAHCLHRGSVRQAGADRTDGAGGSNQDHRSRPTIAPAETISRGLGWAP